jgi:putative sigma-54 modulation protein
MTTEVTFRHFDAVPDLRDHALKGVNKLTRYYDGITKAHVVLDIENESTDLKSAEISLGVYRQTLTASEIAETHEEAINRCVSQLKRQILRYKDRLRSIDKDVHR